MTPYYSEDGITIYHGDCREVLPGLAFDVIVSDPLPPEWPTFSRAIRYDRAGGRCECQGECGLHRTTPGPRRCMERDGQPAVWARGLVRLTVAHLNAAEGPCSCAPLCAIPEHVKAMCNRCHLRYDGKRHQRRAFETRRAGKALGELF